MLILQEKQRISAEPSPDGRVQTIVESIVGEGFAGWGNIEERGKRIEHRTGVEDGRQRVVREME